MVFFDEYNQQHTPVSNRIIGTSLKQETLFLTKLWIHYLPAT